MSFGADSIQVSQHCSGCGSHDVVALIATLSGLSASSFAASCRPLGSATAPSVPTEIDAGVLGTSADVVVPELGPFVVDNVRVELVEEFGWAGDKVFEKDCNAADRVCTFGGFRWLGD